MDDTVVTVRFTDPERARRALRMLKLFGSEGQLRVRAAALVERELEPGVALVVAEVEDPDPDVLEAALDALGGAPTRQPAAAFGVR